MYRVIAFMALLVGTLAGLSGCSTVPLAWPPEWMPGASSSPSGSVPAPAPAPPAALPAEPVEPAAPAAPSSAPAEGPVSVTAGTGSLVRQPDLAPADAAEVKRLVRSAQYALTDGLLIDPPDQSALRFYQRALEIDPDNTDARYGIESIVDQLVARARAAAERGDFASARTILARAAQIDAEHPAVRPAQNELDLLEHARRNVYRLDPAALAQSADSARSQLLAAGRSSRADGCRAIIYARNDTEGRAMYDVMSASSGTARIRAELRIAASPRVETLCFDGAH
jgi:hypothetical protein